MLVSNLASVNESDTPFFLKIKMKKSFFQKQNGWESHTMQLLFEVSFFENRQKSLSPAAKSFLRVVWSYNCYQKIPWTLRNIFHMHNMLWKSIERNLRAKNEASRDFEKSFFGASKIRLWLLGSVISWKSTKFTLSCREIISTCRMIL